MANTGWLVLCVSALRLTVPPSGFGGVIEGLCSILLYQAIGSEDRQDELNCMKRKGPCPVRTSGGGGAEHRAR